MLKEFCKRLVLIAFLCLTIRITSAYSAAIFDSPRSYPAGPYPRSIVTGDFNGDGKADIVTANQDGSGSVSVLLGNGDGTFSAKINYDTYLYAAHNRITAADFNGDGKIDLATANTGSNSVSIFLGSGNGEFQFTNDYRVGYFMTGIVGADFNRDGKVDLAVAGGSNSVSIFLGNGDGTFQKAISLSSGGLDPYGITSADFNGDGCIDLATSNFSGSVTVFLGKGDGTFQTRQDYTAMPYLMSITSGDFNNDGKIDLAAASGYIGANVSILMGNGDGTFQTSRSYYVGSGPYDITTSDFNGDGKADLAFARVGGSVAVLFGIGDGTFGPATYYNIGDSISITTGDFNGDGRIDLATASYGNHSVSILLNISNSPPRASAGADQKIECAAPSGALVILDGSGSRDPDGDPLTYIWTWPGGTAKGRNPTVELPLGTTTVTLTVSDGKVTSTDEVNITIGDTSPPITSAFGVDGEWHNTNIILSFSSSDTCTGVKEIHYNIDGSETATLGDSASFPVTSEGIHAVTYFAVDNMGNREPPKSFIVKIDKTPPTLNLTTNPSILWSPNRKMIDVSVIGGAVDVLSGVISVVFNVTDEYGIVQPIVSGFNTTIPLEAWREGMDKDGRKYTITALATDAAGNTSISSTTVLVPHDER